jgi:hypothetical protein
MRMHRFGRGALAALIVAAGGLSVGAQPSFAGLGYGPGALFAEGLSEPKGVAVNEATGDVYVVETRGDSVQEFNAQGEDISQFNGSGTLPNEGKAAGSGGLPGEEPTGQFSEPEWVAVDNSKGPASGDVYVADVRHKVVDVFSASGKYLSQIAHLGSVKGLATDPAGNLFVYNGGTVEEYDDSGARLTSLHGSQGPSTLAVDSKDDVYLALGGIAKFSNGKKVTEWEPPSVNQVVTGLAVNAAGNIFAQQETGISEYAPYAEPVEQIGSFGPGGPGLAVDASNGTLYDVAYNEIVYVYKPVLLPYAHTGAASGVGKTAATVSGSVKREGLATKYHFEYGTTPSYGSSTPVASVAGEEEEEVSAGLSGLQPATTYFYKLIAENENGQAFDFKGSFTTEPAVSEVSTGPATAVGTVAATLTGSLAPDGLDTHYYFEYGESEAYGMTTRPVDAGSGSVVEPATAAISGLSFSTTYHYRLVAENAIGVTRGADETLTTLPVLPSVTDQPLVVADVSRTAALVAGTIDDEHNAAAYHFEYVDAAEYEPGVANPYAAGASSGVGEVEASLADQTAGPVALEGLHAGTTYHFRLTASNAAGTTYGLDYTFTTATATPPVVTTGAASEVTQTGVLLAGTVDTQELQTSYEFEVGTDTSYGGAKLFGNAGRNGIEAVSASLQFLIPGTTYHYRLVATNEDGTTYGQDVTFTTPGVPAIIAQSVALPFVPSAAVAFPNISGAITKAQGTGKKKAKPKKRKPSRRRRAVHGNARGRGGSKKGGRKRK